MIVLALRRGLWLATSLALITIVSFGALSSAIPPAKGQVELPLFLNPSPGRVQRLAREIVDGLAVGGQSAKAAARELSLLGGAALPSILPHLDALSPAGRTRVASALEPVGRRMGFDVQTSADVNRAILFWGRFWEEHAIDFRPVVAERAVSRLAMRSTPLRDAEVRRLDTYALDALQRAIREKGSSGNAASLARLTKRAAVIAGQPELALAADASPDACASVVARWEVWWGRNRTRYKTYRGSERIVAMLRDTRYGEWVTQISQGNLGRLDNGGSVGEGLRMGGYATLYLALWSAFGVWLSRGLRLVAAAWLEAQRLLWLRLFLGAAASVPFAVLLAWTSRQEWTDTQRSWLAPLLATFAAGCGAIHSRRLTTRSFRTDSFRRGLVRQGVSPALAELRAERSGAPVADVHWASDASRVVTVVFIVEYAVGIDGLGTQTIEAFHRGNLDWLMAIVLATAGIIGLIQMVRDTVQAQSMAQFRSSDALSDWSQ